MYCSVFHTFSPVLWIQIRFIKHHEKKIVFLPFKVRSVVRSTISRNVSGSTSKWNGSTLLFPFTFFLWVASLRSASLNSSWWARGRYTVIKNTQFKTGGVIRLTKIHNKKTGVLYGYKKYTIKSMGLIWLSKI